MKKSSAKRKLDNKETSDQPKMKQSLLKESVSGELRASRERQEEAVARFVVGTNSPFSIVEHIDFVNLMKVAGGLHPLNRKRLMDKLQNSLEIMKEELKNCLGGVQYVSTTADCWTVFKRSYLGMTVHWIDPNSMKRNSKGLCCKRIYGSHTYDILVDAIENILDEYSIKARPQ